MIVSQTKDRKKFTPARFKTDRKQRQPRPFPKNVDPFRRNSRRANHPIRKTGAYSFRRPLRRRRRRARSSLYKRYRRYPRKHH
jgi:hypothetical protein